MLDFFEFATVLLVCINILFLEIPMRPQLIMALMFIFTLSMGCSSRSEGTEKGDCTDKADNDGDGAFDCSLPFQFPRNDLNSPWKE